MAPAEPIRILGVAGSLREASMNRRLARLAGRLVPEGVEYVEYDALHLVEPFDEDVEESGFPSGAANFAAAIRGVDGVFVATPEYNGSIPGQLKNALDWASRADGAVEAGTKLQGSPLYGVPVAVASASNGQFGAVWARDELVKVLRTQGARPISEPSVTVPNGDTAFTEDGDLASEQTTERLRELLDELVAMVRMLREARERAAERERQAAAS
jgi:chromate reductase